MSNTQKTRQGAPTGSKLLSSYSSLSSLGAPVSLEEFTRLYKGPLADALEFLGDHVVGRQASAAARAQLFSLQEMPAKSNLKQPSTARTDADKAVARLSGARKSSEVYASQLDDQQIKVQTSQAHMDTLRRQLAHKKRLLILLEVLEAKQTMRMERIKALTKTIDDLKKTAHGSENRMAHVPRQFEAHGESLDAPSNRVSNVKDCLATLHRCSVVPSRLFDPPPEEELLLRLRGVVAGSFDSADAQRVMERCISFARAAAHRRLSPRSRSRTIDIHELEAKLQSNKEKERELQNLADRSSMLRHLCDGYVASIFDFAQITSPALRHSLQEESRLSKGHVDVSRLAIVSAGSSSEPAEEESFTALVARTCRMYGNVTVRAILDEVEHVTKRSHRRYTLMAHGQRLPPLVSTSTDLIDSYRTNMQSTHERTTTILSRKTEKAVKGRLLADEVEALLRESRRVVGLANERKD